MSTLTFLYIFFYYIFLSLSSVKSDKCEQNSPCSCEYEDGRIIDLHKLVQKDYIKSQRSGNLIYFFHACSDIKFTLPKIPLPPNVTLTNECDSTSICLLNLTDYTAKSLGSSKDVQILPLSNSELYNIFLPHKNITTLITLACTNYLDSILDVKQSEAYNHNLILFSKANCPFLENTGLSTGSVLVILLFVLTAVYLLGGAAVLHLLRGARGKEMIPNIDFWTDLPLLVKDGSVFLQNGCKPVILSTSESYDRI